MPRIQVKLNPRTRKSMRPDQANLVLSVGLNVLGGGTTSATPTAQAARLVFYELAMKGDAASPGTVAVGTLTGTLKLVGGVVEFDAAGATLAGGATGGYAVDLEWGTGFKNAGKSARLGLPASIDFKNEAGALELGCELFVGETSEFKYSYDPTNPKKPGDFVTVSMHLLAAPKLEVHDATTILEGFGAQLKAVTKAYAPLRVLAYRSPGNGEQPVFAVFAAGLDPSKPFEVQTHYHGLDSHVESGPHAPRVRALAANGLVILPEGRDLRTGATERWTNVVDQAKTTRDGEEAVKAALGTSAWSPSARIVSMHSAGGDVLRRVAHLSPAKGLEAARLELLDCLYNNPVLDGEKFPPVVDAVVTLAASLGSAPIVYRRATNDDKEPLANGTLALRGAVLEERLGATRFRFFDGSNVPAGADAATKAKYPTSHDHAAKFIGVPP